MNMSFSNKTFCIGPANNLQAWLKTTRSELHPSPYPIPIISNRFVALPFRCQVLRVEARAVAANAAAWPVSDLVRLLLAVAKAKKAGNQERITCIVDN